MAMTKQEVFDKAVAGLASQGFQRALSASEKSYGLRVGADLAALADMCSRNDRVDARAIALPALELYEAAPSFPRC